MAFLLFRKVFAEETPTAHVRFPQPVRMGGASPGADAAPAVYFRGQVLMPKIE
ncbi:hypothetical protein Ga0080574_TMP4439 [Salipiger abyssi]|uniref:Uncharacterized protein n=1 Tax=Salipiger abyssi TaxID=1250539 RepID=A0A1P8UZG1_9RHOB|nr:hypothetical protein Ga0080574_TMP4439 [Salipiger abyssi]